MTFNPFYFNISLRGDLHLDQQNINIIIINTHPPSVIVIKTHPSSGISIKTHPPSGITIKVVIPILQGKVSDFTLIIIKMSTFRCRSVILLVKCI